MNAVDSHIHWFPNAYYEYLGKRTKEPTAQLVGDRWRIFNGKRSASQSLEWGDLQLQFESAARTGYDMSLISSMGLHSDLDGLPAAEAAELARLINEEWSRTQRLYPGRFFAAAALPLQDAQMAIDEIDHALNVLDLRAVSFPGSVGGEPLDVPRLEPVYAHLEERNVPLFIHPTDCVFQDAMSGYDGGLYGSLGRVVDSSAGVLRIVLCGLMDRYPGLKILHFHAGGVLPYVAGRLDKTARVKTLALPPSEYLKRMWVDTAMPHTLTIQMAMAFYGGDRVLYGSDNPCWTPMAAFETLAELELSADDACRVLCGNVQRLASFDTLTHTKRVT